MATCLGAGSAGRRGVATTGCGGAYSQSQPARPENGGRGKGKGKPTGGRATCCAGTRRPVGRELMGGWWGRGVQASERYSRRPGRTAGRCPGDPHDAGGGSRVHAARRRVRCRARAVPCRPRWCVTGKGRGAAGGLEGRASPSNSMRPGRLGFPFAGRRSHGPEQPAGGARGDVDSWEETDHVLRTANARRRPSRPDGGNHWCRVARGSPEYIYFLKESSPEYLAPDSKRDGVGTHGEVTGGRRKRLAAA